MNKSFLRGVRCLVTLCGKAAGGLSARMLGGRDHRRALVIDALEPRLCLSTVNWTGAAGDNLWHTAGNWDLGVPTINDDAVINVAANPTIVFNSTSGTRSVRSVTSSETLNIQGGSLTITNPSTFNAPLLLSGGTLSGSLTLAGSGHTLTSGTLNGATINGDFTVNSNALLSITNGLTLNGAATLGDATSFGVINFASTQTLGGNATITFGSVNLNNGLRVSTSAAALTLASTVTVQGQSGFVGYRGTFGGPTNVAVINQGIIQTTSGVINIQGDGVRNEGAIRALGTGTISLQGSAWRNIASGVNGVFYADTGSSIEHFASFSTVGDTVVLAGPGIHNLYGTFTGVTIKPQSTQAIFRGATLDNVTLWGNATVPNGTSIYIRNGLTLINNSTLTIASTGNSTSIYFYGGAQNLGGSGSVVLGGTGSANFIYLGYSSAATTLTVGPGVTIRGNGGVYYASYASSVVNQGLIDSNTPGGSLSVNPGLNLTNTGAVHAAAGTVIYVYGNVTNQASAVWSADGGAIVQLSATVNNAGATFTFSGTGGELWLYGTLQGGTLASANSQSLLRLRSATLDAVTLASNATVLNADAVYIRNGLTFSNSAALTLASTGNSTNMYFYGGAQTLGGAGSVVLAGTAPADNIYLGYSNAATTLTIAGGVSIIGWGNIAYASYASALLNQGLIDSTVAANSISINPGLNFTSTGTVHASAGSAMYVYGNVNNQTNAVWSADSGAIVQFNATVNNSAATFTFSGTGGELWLYGTLQGGTLASANAQSLLRLRNLTLDAVTLASNATVLNADAIYIRNGLTLINNAALTLASAGNSTNMYFYGGVQSLGGSGSIVFGGTGTANNIYMGYSNAATTLTITGGVSITGKGVISYASYASTLLNLGLIDSTAAANSITINPGLSFTNTGTVHAAAGSVMYVYGNVTGHSSGIWRADGGAILQLNATVNNAGATFTFSGTGGELWLYGSFQGGTLASANAQSLLRLRGVTLDGVILASDATVSNADSIYIRNGLSLINNAALTLASVGNSTTMYFYGGAQALGGSGSIVFAGTSSANYIYLGYSNAATALTIAPGITLRGSGALSYSSYASTLVNQGLIRADVANNSLTVSPGSSFINASTMLATNNATLSIGTDGLSTGTITVDATGTFSGTYRSGTISVAPGGSISNATLDGVTLVGDATIPNNTSSYVRNGLTLANNATLTLASVGNATNLFFYGGTQSINGSGSVVFGGASSANFIQLGYNNSSTTLTVANGITIRGRGGIFYYSYLSSLINQGLILADADTLIVAPGSTFINAGSMLATNNATLSISTDGLSTGTITVDATGTFSGTYRSGTISVAPGGRLTTAMLDAVTLTGDATIPNNTSSFIRNGLTLSNNATLTLASVGNATNLYFYGGTQSINGSGSIILGGTSSANSLYLGYNNSGTTLTVTPGITIRGDGSISYYNYASSLINQGTLRADTPNNPLTIAPGASFVNAGTMLATNNATLSIGTDGLSTGTITVDATGTFSGTYRAGTISVTTGGRLSNATLDAVSITGDALIPNNSSIYIRNGLTLLNNATITLASVGNATTMYFYGGAQTLSGSGSIVFGGTSTANNIYLGYSNSSTTLTVAPGITIRGKGGISYYNYLSTLINQGTISADSPNNALAISPGASITNQGTLSATPSSTLNTGPLTLTPTSIISTTLAGTANSQIGRFVIGGAATLAGRLSVSLAPGFVPAVGNVFRVMDYSSFSGQFTDYLGLVLPGGTLEPSPNLNNFSLTTTGNNTQQPDLRITGISVNPPSPQSGQTITINWSDFNAGIAAAGSSWTDRITLTNTTTNQVIATSDVLYSTGQLGSLNPGQSRARSATITLPAGYSGAGPISISIAADINNQIVEYYPGLVGEANNTTTASFVSTLAPSADLIPVQIIFGSPAAESSQLLTVAWNDRNIGNALISASWTDYVEVRNLTTGQVVGGGYVSAPANVLASGGTGPQRTFTFRLPDGAPGVGQLRATVTTDIYNNIPEYNASATAEQNSAQSGTIQSTLNPRPDLIVTSAAVPSSAYTDTLVELTVRFRNTGASAVSGPWAYTVYSTTNGVLEDTAEPFTTIQFDGIIAAGQEVQRQVQIRTPAQLGVRYFVIHADSADAVDEAREDNNDRLANAIQLNAEYAATASTATDIAPAGSPITISGVTTRNGNPTPNRTVEVRVSTANSTRTLTAFSDASGHFQTTFNPLPTEVGVYTIRAANPAEPQSGPAQDTFRLIGMSVSGVPQLLDIVSAAAPAVPQLTISNPVDVTLTNVRAELVSAPANVLVFASFSDGSSAARLDPGAAAYLNVSISATSGAGTTGSVTLRLTSAQGAERLVELPIRILASGPVIVGAGPASPVVVTAAAQAVFDVNLSNTGGLPSSSLAVSLQGPSWLTLASPDRLASLAAGASTSLSLQAIAPAGTPAGNLIASVRITGNGTDVTIPVQLTVSTAQAGSLAIAGIDELFYNDPAHPRVGGATVTLRRLSDNTVVAQTTADANGLALLGGVAPGTYRLQMNSEKHDGVDTQVEVRPGAETQRVFFMPRRTASYQWTFQRRPVDDQYVIELRAVFETAVRMPVIALDQSSFDACDVTSIGQTVQWNLSLTNTGLIAADNVRLSAEQDSRFRVVPLVSSVGRVLPNETRQIPVLITRIGAGDQNSKRIIPGLVQWDVTSGPFITTKSAPIAVVGDCSAAPSPPPAPIVPIEPIRYNPPEGGGDGSGGGGGSGGAYGPGAPMDPRDPSPGAPPYQPGDPSPPQTITIVDTIAARVTIQIDQTALLARETFIAGIDYVNTTGAPQTGFSLPLSVKDLAGIDRTDRFRITVLPPVIGIPAIDGSADLPAGATASVRWEIIPKDEAAGASPIEYVLSLDASYAINGIQSTDRLVDQRLTVLPTPNLSLDYFLQRDVIGDDPLTTQIVERSVPFDLGVLVHNQGYGTAENLRINSAQPRIIRNDQGLLINFEIIGSQVGALAQSPSLTLGLGDIAPSATQVGRWLLTSSLQGKFVEYSATFQQRGYFQGIVSPLISAVNIHELIHSVKAVGPGMDNVIDFLANDTADAGHTPDRVYFSTGGSAPVTPLTNFSTDGPVTPDDLSVRLTVSGAGSYQFLRMPDPGNGLYRISRITRPDGSTLPLESAWLTDRTFTDAPSPTYENMFNLFDNVAAGTGVYTLEFALRDDLPPTAVVTPDAAINGRTNAVTITFSEPVTGFDPSDLALTLDSGVTNLLTPAQSLTTSDGGRTWRLSGLSSITSRLGTYTLTLLGRVSGVQDSNGNPMIADASAAWMRQATIAWDGEAGDNNWHTAQNWTDDRLPTSADEVLIPDWAGVELFESNTSLRYLEVAGGLTLSGPALASSTDITILGGLAWTSGSISTITGLTIDPAAELDVSSPAAHTLTGPTTIRGVLRLDSANLSLNAAAILVDAGAHAYLSADSTITATTGTSSLRVRGDLTNESGNSQLSSLPAASFTVLVENTLTLAAGALTVNVPFIHSGIAVTSAGASLVLAVASTFTESSRVIGAGLLRFGPGTHTVSSPLLAVGGLEIDGGDVQLGDTNGGTAASPLISVLGDVTFTSGRLSLSPGAIIAAGGAFTMTGASLLEIASESEGVYGRVIAAGNAALDGTLRLTSVHGFDPTNPYIISPFTMQVVTAAAVTGHIDLEAFATSIGFLRTLQLPNSLSITLALADFNGDGGVDGSDVDSFFDAWTRGLAFADVNGDGGVDGADVSVFFDLWERG
ncbi:MAG: hypothetical protein JSR77_10805 [Planctomycetes bacterium]|nr:hypothetical protein [Planctomycetota bacterium]